MSDLESKVPVEIDGELFHTLFSEMCAVSWDIFADDLEKKVGRFSRIREGHHVSFEEAGLFLDAKHVKEPIGGDLLLSAVYYWRHLPFLSARVYKDHYILNEIKQ